MENNLMKVTETEVLIVGSGGSGLVVATCLAQMGVSCRIIEKRAQPFAGSRGKGLLPRALEYLDNMGVLNEVRTEAEWCEATPLNSIFYNGELIGASMAMGPCTSENPYFVTAIVPQWHTEGTLRKCLSSLGVEVEWSTEFLGFDQREGGGSAVVRGPDGETQSIHYAILVGCDGAHSAVRKSLGINYVGGVVPDANWLVGDIEIDGLELPEPKTGANGYGWVTKNGALFVRRFAHGDNWQFQAQIQADESGALPSPTLDTLQQILEERSERTDIRVKEVGAWLNTFAVKVGYAEKIRSGRVFLAGEAAHVQPGGGLCSAIYDSTNLAWKIGTVMKGGPVWLLDTYEDERGRSVREEIETVRALLYKATGLESASQADSEPDPHQMLNALNDPETAHQMSGLMISYRQSPLSLSWEDAMNGGVLAGDRAPDAPCLDSSTGETTTLFDVYRGHHWTLLGFGPQGAELINNCQVPEFIDVRTRSILKQRVLDGVHAALADTKGHAHDAFAVTDNAIVLIRPDNHIGMIARSADMTALNNYFGRLQRAV
ncbi:FAD-dependent monooxygenase [Nocardia sp. NPDC046763]|uniref:FAD-dependent monooxygenase n=1 Tax=Nocardia sp. NPDC046763 TaxID=3155256 RepID=UPI0033ECA7E0